MRTARLTGAALLAGTLAAVLVSVLVGAATSSAGVRDRSGTIAFLRSGSGISARSGLFAIQADGSGLRRLTPTGSDISAYAWSPHARGRWALRAATARARLHRRLITDMKGRS
jgi:hypothetical protein